MDIDDSPAQAELRTLDLLMTYCDVCFLVRLNNFEITEPLLKAEDLMYVLTLAHGYERPISPSLGGFRTPDLFLDEGICMKLFEIRGSFLVLV